MDQRIMGKMVFPFFLLMATFMISSFSYAQTQVIAHRGNSSAAPENTLSAVQSALELTSPPAYIEIDLHRSKDGVLVVCHDFSLDRTTDKSGFIRELTFAEIRQYDAEYSEKFQDRFEGEKVPRLEEVLDVVKDQPVGIMIECKQLFLEEQVIEILRQRNEVDKHILASFDEITVHRAKKIEPKLKTLYLTSSLNQVSLWRAQDLKADFIGAHHDMEPQWVQRAKQAGFKVWVWTVDDKETMRTFINAGVDGLISNVPAKVQQVLSSLNE